VIIRGSDDEILVSQSLPSARLEDVPGASVYCGISVDFGDSAGHQIDLERSEAGVNSSHTRQSVQVGRLCTIRVDEGEMSDAETGQPDSQAGTEPSKPDDADLCCFEPRLAFRTEGSYLPVEAATAKGTANAVSCFGVAA